MSNSNNDHQYKNDLTDVWQSKIFKLFYRRSLSNKCCLPSKSSSIKGCLSFSVIFLPRLSSIHAYLPSLAFFAGSLPLKVVFHNKFSQERPSKDVPKQHNSLRTSLQAYYDRLTSRQKSHW